MAQTGTEIYCGDNVFPLCVLHVICVTFFKLVAHKSTLFTCSSFTGGLLSCRLIKLLSWLMAIIQSLLIIASRKHYTVDVVVAW